MKTVLMYEFLGTSILSWAVLASGGNSAAVAATFFMIILYIAPISGAHVNPAVSTAVFVSRQNYVHDGPFFVLIMLAQFAGALLGVFWSWLILMPSAIKGLESGIPTAWLVPLCPRGVADDGSLQIPCDIDLDRNRAAFFS